MELLGTLENKYWLSNKEGTFKLSRGRGEAKHIPKTLKPYKNRGFINVMSHDFFLAVLPDSLLRLAQKLTRL